MKKGLTKSDERYSRQINRKESYCLGNLDLVKLRLGSPCETPRSRLHDKGSGDSYRSDYRNCPAVSREDPSRAYDNRTRFKGCIRESSEEIVRLYPKESGRFLRTEPISQNDFLYPTKKKVRPRSSDRFGPESVASKSHFPFKPTPSGKLKVESSQVVFASKKLSVLVADPKHTKINITPQPEDVIDKMTNNPDHHHHHRQQEFAKTPHSPMETLMSQAGGFSSLGSIIGNSPVRSPTKEASEYESKQTNEILDPELNLGRLGYNGNDSINWDKVKLPEKQNLYLELYHRITNNKNADCKVYIENEEFNCHLIVLQSYSELFDAYVAVKKVELPSDKCSVTAFSFIYEWMITGEPSYIHLNRENVLDIFISAKYLKIKDLVEQCWAFIDNIEVFNEDTAFLLYMDAKRRNLPEVKELMLPRIQSFFLMLVSSQDWLELDVDDVKNLLKSNYIAINCEMEIFMSAVRWLRHEWQNREKNKYEVLECVRFGNIAPWQLVDIKRNPENPDFMELAKDLKICKMIDDGLAYVIIKYWYGQENEDFQHWNTVLGLQEPPARNWNGPDKTYFTFREFLIYLDQYRRNQLIEKNKPKLTEKQEKKQKEPRLHSERSSPRVPTMEEFMSKKKPTGQKKMNKNIF